MPRVPLYQGSRAQRDLLPDLSRRVAGRDAERLPEPRRRELRLAEEAEFLAAQNRALELERALFDPEAGFLATKGEAAGPARADAFSGYLETLQALGRGLSSPRLRRLWQETAGRRAAAAGAAVEAAGERQTRGWLADEERRLLDHLVTAALAEREDPDRFAAALEVLSFDAALHARRQGSDAGAATAFAAEQRGRVHDAVLARLLEDGATVEATDYLHHHGDDLPAERRSGLERQLSSERRLQEGRMAANAALSRAPAGPERFARAFAALDAVSDPALRAVARRRIEAQRRDALGASPVLRAEREALETEAERLVTAGANPDELPPRLRIGLGEARLEILRRRFDGPEERATDYALYGALSALPPQRLAAADLLAASPSLAETDYRLLKERQATARQLVSGAGAADDPFVFQARREALLDRQTDDPETRGWLSAETDRRLSAAARAKGAPLSVEEGDRVLESSLRSLSAPRVEVGSPSAR